MITPVILSGGAGTRLWPLSRALRPKQYWALVNQSTLLQETALRFSSTTQFNAPMVICNDEHRFLVAEQLRKIGVTPSRIVLETEARNTAPAITIACLLQTDLDSLLLVLPADHTIQKPDVFYQAITTARPIAEQGKIIMFGIHIDRPETGYGYIELGNSVENSETIFEVSRFIEKPDVETAKYFLSKNNYYWNSGIFLFKVSTLLAELERLHPTLVQSCRQALCSANHDFGFLRIDSEAIMPEGNLSIDHALMEQTSHAAVIPIDMGWSDIGSWDSLWEISHKDEHGNTMIGDIVTHNVHNSYIRSDKQLLSVLGLDNIIVVATEDATLVAHKDHIYQINNIIQKLKKTNRPELNTHKRVFRPWGYYQTLQLGKRFQTKQITVNPGAKISSQLHYHRSEYWVVVEGIAKVSRGNETLLIHENESIYLPKGIQHRVENPGKIPLHIIEVQLGSYLGEDDIIRIEDMYGRARAL